MKEMFQSWIKLFILPLALTSTSLFAFDIQRIEPAHWWTGMKNKNLQILVHGKDIGKTKPELKQDWPGVRLKDSKTTSNPDYLFLNLEINAEAKAGKIPINFRLRNQKEEILFPLKAHSEMAAGAAGYGNQDVLYLIMPDRFANGNTMNDNIPGFLEKADRSKPSGRHGGDLAGIDQHLDYLKNLGITTIWLNPIQQNNQPEYSYHGYAITDHYQVDARHGSLEEYKMLIRNCHQMGLKMVQDMVSNHIGNQHYWMKSLPDSGWVHYAGQPYTPCNFRIETIPDPHAGGEDRERMTDGWFDHHMADLNQRHPLLARYLIQNAIWWIAETGIDGIRMDTWPYNDKEFMNRWCQDVLLEFPKFTIVGEIWVDQPALTSYFTEGAKNQDGYRPTLPSCTDFPLYFALTKGLQEKGSWDSGLIRIYQTLSQDFLYKDASRNLIFASNHDLSRFITTQQGNYQKYRQAMAILLCMRGTPQIYYGDEFALEGDGSQHSNVRLDFKGGWPGDQENYFRTDSLYGRTDSAFRFVQNLLQWRKTSAAVAKGSFIHYLPQDNVYVFFRKWKNELVMVAVNGNPEARSISTKRFSELQDFKKNPVDVESHDEFKLTGNILSIPAQGFRILEFRE